MKIKVKNSPASYVWGVKNPKRVANQAPEGCGTGNIGKSAKGKA